MQEGNKNFRQQWLKQNSNTSQSLRNVKELPIQSEYRPLFFQESSSILKTSRGLWLGIAFMAIIGVLMLLIFLSIKSLVIIQRWDQMKYDILKLQDQALIYQNQNRESSNNQLEQMKQEIMKQFEQTKNDQKEIDRYQLDQIAGLKDSLTQTKDTLIQIAFQQVQNQKEIENLPVLQQRQIELISNVRNISKDIDEVKKQFPELSLNLNVLSSETKRQQQDMITTQLLSPKLEGISVKVEHLQGDLDKVQTQQQTMISSSSASPLINNIDSQIFAIKTDIETLKSQVPFAGVLPTIEHYGPFIGNTYQPSFIAIDTEMTIYQTTQPCFLTVQRKAVITLIATGMAYCNIHGQMTFMKDRQINLEKTGDLQKQYGVQFVFRDWTPVNLTQEFYVDEGTYEFTLGMNSISGQYTFTTQSLSFVAKVQYIQ